MMSLSQCTPDSSLPANISPIRTRQAAIAKRLRRRFRMRVCHCMAAVGSTLSTSMVVEEG